ncbi:uncharacterized protein VTP21DRAFT_1929 [Calcarisporiella thermophila]|uniref:uncharacterized protein n=1 Tax=Calcarisporiella thermophila TaxID=911321 RepID=UPI003743B840
MNTVNKMQHGHDDLIHDVAYDFYGRRFVTCSSDQRLKVWDWNEEKKQWDLNDSWKAHDCSILKVAWAHPEFGQVIASCSFDKSIRIWEEQEREAKNSGRRWIEKARLVESSGSVQDIEFAPNYFGLKLASIGADGMLRIYEATEVINLASWTIMEEISVNPTGAESKGMEANYCLSWCPNRFMPEMIVVGCGRENTAKIFRCDQTSNKWHPYEILEGHNDVVHDVAWAPSMGRSYQLIATSSKDHRVRIFKLTEDGATGAYSQTTGAPVQPSAINVNSSKKRFRIERVMESNEHEAEVWRVEWNITGTILTSSGDDGKLRLWKCGYDGVWQCASIISAEQRDGGR